MLFYYIWLLSECQEFYEIFLFNIIDIFMKPQYNNLIHIKNIDITYFS